MKIFSSKINFYDLVYITVLMIFFVIVNPVAIAGETAIKSLEKQRPSSISDDNWDSLKQAIQSEKIFSRDGHFNGIGNSISLDPIHDRVVVGEIGAQDNGIGSGTAYVFELEQNIWIQKAKLLPDDGVSHQQFGRAVAIDNDKIVVSAPGSPFAVGGAVPGAVYVFSLDGDQWSQSAKLVFGNTEVNQNGIALSLVNNRLLVGDWLAKNNASIQTGAAYIIDYDPVNSVWLPGIKLLASDGTANDTFGYAAELDSGGTRAVIGALNDSDIGGAFGSVYVFEQQGNNWVQTSKLTSSDAVVGDRFGSDVSVSGNVIAVGNRNSQAYVFEHINGLWQETTILSSGIADSRFGEVLKIYNNVIAIAQGDPSVVYMYKKSTSTWTLDQSLGVTVQSGLNISLDMWSNRMIAGIYNYGANYFEHDSGPVCGSSTICFTPHSHVLSTETSEGDGFGVAVDVSGNRAIIGAYEDDDKGNNSGAAYVFGYNASTHWELIQKLTAIDGEANDAFGRSVAIEGDRLLVGAYHDDYSIINFNVVDAGSVYVFDFDGSRWNQTQQLKSGEGVQSIGDLFGFSIDLDADLILIGAHSDDENGVDSGAAYIYELQNNTWAQTEKIMAAVNDDAFGYAVSLDGNRALMGAFKDDENDTNSGAAYIYDYDLNSDSWLQSVKLLPFQGNSESNDYFGTSVSLDGDKALVGSFYDDLSINTGENQGSVSFFYKVPGLDQWSSAQTIFASDADLDDRFGYSVSLKGNRALVGSWLDDDHGSASGSAYLFDFDENTLLWSETEKITADDGGSEDYFGVALALSEDWVLVGAHREDTYETDSGSVFIYQDDLIFKNGFE